MSARSRGPPWSRLETRGAPGCPASAFPVSPEGDAPPGMQPGISRSSGGPLSANEPRRTRCAPVEKEEGDAAEDDAVDGPSWPRARGDLVVSQFSIATDSRGVSLVEGEHATEPFASADAADGRGRIAGGEGDDVAQALVVALGVVVLHELAHDGAQMTLAEGDDVPEALVLDRPNEPLGVGVEVRAPRRAGAAVARPRLAAGSGSAPYRADPDRRSGARSPSAGPPRRR